MIEFLLQLLGEFLAQFAGEALAEAGLHSLTDSRQYKINPALVRYCFAQ